MSCPPKLEWATGRPEPGLHPPKNSPPDPPARLFLQKFGARLPALLHCGMALRRHLPASMKKSG